MELSPKQQIALMQKPAFKSYVAECAKEAHINKKLKAVGVALLGIALIGIGVRIGA